MLTRIDDYAFRNNISRSAAIRTATLDYINLRKQGRWVPKPLDAAPKGPRTRVNYPEWISVLDTLLEFGAPTRADLADEIRAATHNFVASMKPLPPG